MKNNFKRECYLFIIILVLFNFMGCTLSVSENKSIQETLTLKQYVASYSIKINSDDSGKWLQISTLFPKPSISRDGVVTMKNVTGVSDKYNIPSQDIYVAIPCGCKLDDIKISKTINGGSYSYVTISKTKNASKINLNLPRILGGKKYIDEDMTYKLMSNGNCNYVKITITPCHYNHFIKTLKFNTFYNINVAFEKKKSPVSMTDSILTPTQANNLKAMVINPEVIDTYTVIK